MVRTQDQWATYLAENRALQIPDASTHLWCGGMHWDGLFLPEVFVRNDLLLSEMAGDLVRRFVESGGDVLEVGCTIGEPPYGSKLAFKVAVTLATLTKQHCRAYFAQKTGNGQTNWMWAPRGFVTPQEGDRALIVDPFLTSEENVHLMGDFLTKHGAEPLPYVLTPVNGLWQEGRGLDVQREVISVEDQRIKVLSLVERPMQRWPSQACALCEAGSRAIDTRV